MATDVGDTLATARSTQLASPAAGDHSTIASSTIGDGPQGTRDVDIYEITGVAGITITVTTSQPSASNPMNTVLRLFNSAGTQVAINDDFASGNYSQISYTFPTAGSYFVGVSGAGNINYVPTNGSGAVAGATGDYRLDMSLDVGDSLATAAATGINLTGTFKRSSTAIGDGAFTDRDVDLYKFSGKAGTTLSATSQPSSANGLDTVLRVFDSAGVQASIDDNLNSSTSTINYTLPKDGVYYIGVSGAGNASYDPASLGSGLSGSIGDYGLALALRSPAEFELGDLASGNGSQGFTVTGTDNYSELTGPSQYRSVGDLNGDTLDDFILGAPGDIGATSMRIGQVYLVFGTTSGFPAELDPSTLNGSNGYIISGTTLGDRTGFAGGGAGDVNGDGLNDLVIGAIWGNPSSTRLKAGQSFVVFGGSEHLAALDLANGSVDGVINVSSLNGADGFTINGSVADENAGRPTGVGDINKDGYGDLLIGAYSNGVSGKNYVVFGKASFSTSPVVELATIATGDGSIGFVIPATTTADSLGLAVAGAGDVNGDNIDDMIVGSSGVDLTGKANAGQAYVIFGKDSNTGNFPNPFVLTTLNGTNGFAINGAAADDGLGVGVAGAGDVNNDGLSDVLVGAAGVDYNGKLSSGSAYLIFGKPSFGATLDVASLNGINGGAFRGVSKFDSLGESVSSAGDFNNDGYDDVLLGARYASPNGNSSAGQSYLIYGGPSMAANFELSSLLASNGGDGSNGIAFNGFQAAANAFRANGIGDVNKDGFSDIRIGSPYYDNALVAPGQAYIVFGKPTNPGVRVMAPSGLITSESGGTAKFTVTLATQPLASVTIPISSSDLSEGTASVSGLTFTPENWNVPQVVVVTGVNDNYSDNDIRFSVPIGAAVSDDPAYNGIDPIDVSLTNSDNDIFTSTFLKTQNSSIPDPGTLTSSLTVTNTGTILDLNVLVNINHTWDEDLDVFLVAPDGTRVELFTDVGGLGVNFTNTLLDDESTSLIASGVAPFTGTYKPEGNLTSLEGKSLAGIWKLEVTDDTRTDRGTLLNWSIIAKYATAPKVPGAVVTPITGLVTTESGGTATFTVKLDNKPTSDVTIPVSSNDTTEGTVSATSLVFTPDNWNSEQTITVTGVDDTIVDGNVPFTVLLGLGVSADPDFNGLNPSDVSVTNSDNDTAPTKFYVVNDGTPDRTYEYGTTGSAVENYALNSANTASRGIASNLAGDRVWVADANRKVYVYNTSGTLLGSWTAGTLTSTAQVEGITVFGNDVWIVDRRSDKVFKYTGGANLLSGTATSATSFNLNTNNTTPKGIVTDGNSIWVINDSTTDKVFKYNMTGTLLGSWTIDSANSAPTGLTIDPNNVSNIWTVDSGTKRIYQYDGAASRTIGSQTASASYALAVANSNPQDIADPPVNAMGTSSFLPGVAPASDLATNAATPAIFEPIKVERQSSVDRIQRKLLNPTAGSEPSLSPTKISLGQNQLVDLLVAQQSDSTQATHDAALLELVSESFGDLLKTTKRIRRG